MSIHPSLSGASLNSKQGSVMKRSERLKNMLEKGTWHPGDPVFGLPKIKSVKIKIKKEKAEKIAVEGAAPAAEGAAPAAKAAAAPAAKATAKPEKGAK